MPARTMLAYVQHKFVHETKRDIYFADLLWVQATGKYFTEYPRYFDLINKDKAPPDNRTADEIVDDTIAAFLGE